MNNKIDFSIVFPVMNQGDHIGEIIQAYQKALKRERFSFELIAVVNCTTDRSFEICEKVAKKLPNVWAYELSGCGFGLGILHGLKYSKGKYLCYLNCARIRPEDLVMALKAFTENPKVMIHCVRRERHATHRKLGSLIYNKMVKFIFNLQTSDINGNPKVFSRDHFDKLKLTSIDSMIDLEFLDRAQKLKVPVREVPIFHYRRHGGRSTSNFSTIFRLMKEAGRYFIKTRLFQS